MEFEGKAVFITGGAAGLGRAVARAFAREGANVAITDVDAVRGEQTAQALRSEGGRQALFVKADVRSSRDVAGAIAQTVQAFGGLDVAVNNAGVTQVAKPITEQSEELFDQLFDINVKGVWLAMKYELPELLKRGGGAVVNVSSGVGTTGAPGMAFYVATKHAILGLTRSAALEFARHNVRINAVCPGAINTGMVEEFRRLNPEQMKAIEEGHPIGRISEPEEVAEAVLFLASRRASFVVGSAFAVDGGYTAQ